MKCCSKGRAHHVQGPPYESCLNIISHSNRMEFDVKSVQFTVMGREKCGSGMYCDNEFLYED